MVVFVLFFLSDDVFGVAGRFDGSVFVLCAFRQTRASIVLGSGLEDGEVWCVRTAGRSCGAEML